LTAASWDLIRATIAVATERHLLTGRLAVAAKRCSWCQIDDELRQQVASRNPFRILDHFGLLEGYIEGADAIGGKNREGKT
jgi:hypothetical protein